MQADGMRFIIKVCRGEFLGSDDCLALGDESEMQA
jgi:hypothetical protein